MRIIKQQVVYSPVGERHMDEVRLRRGAEVALMSASVRFIDSQSEQEESKPDSPAATGESSQLPDVLFGFFFYFFHWIDALY